MIGQFGNAVRSDSCVTFVRRRCAQNVVHYRDNMKGAPMKDTTPTRIRVRRFLTDRYAYRTQPNYLSELVAFGIVLFTAGWPILILAKAMAGTLK